VCGLDQIHAFAFSTHALSLHLSIDMILRARKLEVCLIGIQAGRVELGEGPSSAIREAVETLVDALTALFRPAGQERGR